MSRHLAQSPLTSRPVANQLFSDTGRELSELARLYPQVAAQAPDVDTPEQTLAHAQAGDVTIFQRDVELLRLRQEVEHLRRELTTTQDREQTALDRVINHKLPYMRGP
jgi:HAMP domain-containing protein